MIGGQCRLGPRGDWLGSLIRGFDDKLNPRRERQVGSPHEQTVINKRASRLNERSACARTHGSVTNLQSKAPSGSATSISAEQSVCPPPTADGSTVTFLRDASVESTKVGDVLNVSGAPHPSPHNGEAARAHSVCRMPGQQVPNAVRGTQGPRSVRGAPSDSSES